MKHRLPVIVVWVVGLIGSNGAVGQVPLLDQTTLNGNFNFIYGVYQRSNSSVVMGTLSFDGQGHYTAVAGSATSQGSYRVNLEGTGSLTNWIDPTLPPLSLRVAAGTALIGGSTLEQSAANQHDLLLAIPAATQAPVMCGPWGGLTYLYTPGPRFESRFRSSGTSTPSTIAATAALRGSTVIVRQTSTRWGRRSPSSKAWKRS